MKNSRDSIKWKTHVEFVKKTVIDNNETMSAEGSNEALGQPVEDNVWLFEELCRLYTKMKDLQNAEHDMLIRKVPNEHSKWHLNFQEILNKPHETWNKANRLMNWVSKEIVDNVQNQKKSIKLLPAWSQSMAQL